MMMHLTSVSGTIVATIVIFAMLGAFVCLLWPVGRLFERVIQLGRYIRVSVRLSPLVTFDMETGPATRPLLIHVRNGTNPENSGPFALRNKDALDHDQPVPHETKRRVIPRTCTWKRRRAS